MRTQTLLTVAACVCPPASASGWARFSVVAEPAGSQVDAPAARSAEPFAGAVRARSGAVAQAHCVAAADDLPPADSAQDDSAAVDSAADDSFPADDVR